VLNPLQVISRRAVHEGDLTIDPTVGLNLPAIRGRRDRIASPEQARTLIDALPDSDRAFWATAFYAGLRRGELRALRWRNVDFEHRVIRVVASWDQEEGEIAVKPEAGNRTVPMADPLRRELAPHKLRTGRGDGELVFGRTGSLPFTASTVRLRSLAAWKSAGLDPLSTHEARHCAASYLIAAGLNAKELSVYIGHSDIRTTYNRYGHLMPGGHELAADRLSAFLDAGEASGNG
jgi:integrase